jgi:site-specific DNA-methyltransferase (adenine-specific)
MTVELFLGDCLEYMKTMPAGSVDAVITDPPYPDYWADEYKYFDGILEPLKRFNCRQFIFWSSKVEFPLDYSAIHIWDKRTGTGSEYERIFERNGQKNYKVFRHYFINSTVAASFTGDVFTGHPSQKPKQLLIDLLELDGRQGITIFDPFMGSGTTGVACVQLGRNFIGCEIDPKYFEIAKKRIEQAELQPQLFTEKKPEEKQGDLI